MTRKTFEQDDAVALGAAVAVERARQSGTDGDDRLEGTRRNDSFRLSQGGDDIVFGRGGDDKLVFGSSFSESDKIYGGHGQDVMLLQGPYSGKIDLNADSVKSIEKLIVRGSHSYGIDISDSFDFLKVAATIHSVVPVLDVDASALKTGWVWLDGGLFSDTLTGGAQNDVLRGDFGADLLTGGGGNDRFLYKNQYEGEMLSADSVETIADFEAGDRIVLARDWFGTGYHIGETGAHKGDVIVTRDVDRDMTRLEIFVDGDEKADMVLDLVGLLDNFSVFKGNQITIEPV